MPDLRTPDHADMDVMAYANERIAAENWALRLENRRVRRLARGQLWLIALLTAALWWAVMRGWLW